MESCCGFIHGVRVFSCHKSISCTYNSADARHIGSVGSCRWGVGEEEGGSESGERVGRDGRREGALGL